MALTNYERQKRWREKNRVIYNLRRRNSRKSFPVTKGESSGAIAGVAPKSGAQLSTIDGLRQLMTDASAEPTEPILKPLVYRNDYGQVITEKQFNDLQERKRKAKQGGYEIDEFSQ